MNPFKNIFCLILILIALPNDFASAQFLNGDLSNALPEGTFIINPGGFFRDDLRQSSEKSLYNNLYGDISFGYQFPNRWYIGLIHSFEQEKVVSRDFPVTGESARYEYSKRSTGVSGGYVYGSYYARVHYLFTSDWRVKGSNSSINYSRGWGAQVDIGINFELLSTLLIGPRLSYKYHVYKKQKISQTTSSTNPDFVKSSVDPYFVAWWEF